MSRGFEKYGETKNESSEQKKEEKITFSFVVCHLAAPNYRHTRPRKFRIEPSIFSYGPFYSEFSTFPRDGRRGRSETARALNFYALLGAAAAKSTTSSAPKTASARLPRSSVTLINPLGSIVRFNKVQQSRTQRDGISILSRCFYVASITRVLRHCETYFSLHNFLFPLLFSYNLA